MMQVLVERVTRRFKNQVAKSRYGFLLVWVYIVSIKFKLSSYSL